MTTDLRAERPDIAAELIDDAPCGIAVTAPDGRLQYINATLAGWLGIQRVDPAKRLTLSDLLAPPGRVYYETHMAPMMRLQGHVREISCRLKAANGDLLPVMLSGVARQDARGQPMRFDYTIFDARERRIYEEELRRARREADELAAIVRTSPNAILRVDRNGRIRSWNGAAEQQFRRAAADVVGRSVQETIAFAGMTDWFDRGIATCRTEPQAVFETSDDRDREFEVTIAPIGPWKPSEQEVDWSVVLRDITTRKRSERRLKVVVDEMRHRVKNTLAVITSIARQTVSKPEREAFIARLQALSQAHDALIRSDWTSATLEEILMVAVQEAGGPHRLRVKGPKVELTPKQGTALTMAFHELVTNALKYGALSNDTGYVQVEYDWIPSTDPPQLHLVWQELGGPEVVPPSRTGFGTKMIRIVLEAEIAGEVRMLFPPEGLRCEVIFSPEATAEGRQSH